MTVLRIEHLNRSFGSLVVTNDVTLTVEDGERHVIIGPNGAGKTSLIHQIGGQLAPDGGHIYLKDTDITGWPPQQVARLGIARTFQRNNLFLNLSVLENLRLAVQVKRGNPLDFHTPARRDRAVIDHAERLLAQVHLDGAAGRPVRSLSYGEQRQLEIALALAGDPDLMLLDEPTSGMSPAETERMIALISNLPREIAILMIEHDMNVVFSIADRITVLFFGEVLASGTAAEIQANPRVREVYLGGAH
ncbi:MAG TPA: ABC transporter ATP-binding protein [Stellaceae bacterium]|nr:ABC transporter ATP-binding protein [Stellaceae bacterium]